MEDSSNSHICKIASQVCGSTPLNSVAYAIINSKYIVTVKEVEFFLRLKNSPKPVWLSG